MRPRERLAKLRKLALGGDETSIRQVLEMLGALADGELWRQVLEGCGLREGQPVLGEFFRGPERTLGERRLAWLHLVGGAAADAPRDATLLAPERLRFVGWRLPRWPGSPLPRFATVTEVSFDRCWLAALPDFVIDLESLRRLTVEHARLVEALPARLWRLPLERVRVEHAWLEHFPVAAAGAARLRELSLRDNRIATLPTDLAARLPAALESLDLRANPLDAAARASAERAGARIDARID